MSRNTSFSIGQHFSDFVENMIDQGRYGSASDVVRAGLRLLEEQETKLAAMRAALIEGEQQAVSNGNLRDIWADVSGHAGSS
jgi:antitoxin ParD1/3/4